MKINCVTDARLSGFKIKDTAKFFFAAEKLAAEKLARLGLIPDSAKEITVSLSFLDKTEMQTLNFKYRDTDTATDVLSFPLWEDENGHFAPPEDWTELPLGDIAVCPEVVISNAAENGKEPYEELALVIFHSILHLTGYDHDTEERKNEMWTLQDELTAAFVKELAK